MPDLLELVPAGLPARDVSVWVRNGEGLVGWGRAASVVTHGVARFGEAQAWWQRVSAAAVVQDEVALSGTGPVAFGSLAYSPDSPLGATLVVPRVVVGRRGGATWVTTVEVGAGRDPAGCVLTPIRPPLSSSGPADSPSDVAFADGALSGPQWAQAVATALDLIAAGRIDKVVLARDLQVDTRNPIDPRWVLRNLAAEYARTWVFAVDGLLGATPELLVRLERGLVTSRVLAGTIRRSGDDLRDLALAASLARSSKDLEEHEYAVRSVAEALARHCTSVNVPESPFVLHLPNVMHLATDIAGRLDNGDTSLGLAAALHPSAAVCGTPRPAAEAVIAELERMDRGRYAGPVGWMDAAGDGEWGIGLRSGALDPDDPCRMRLFAGCGIVAGSDPAAELAESNAKLVPMRSALEGPRP
ncbi:MAG TPA: isochorismate synthase [Dermatophilaceae bacterium]|nr:isochorismate synthase [Dermatophilaceae bacterium]